MQERTAQLHVTVQQQARESWLSVKRRLARTENEHGNRTMDRGRERTLTCVAFCLEVMLQARSDFVIV